jgi:Ca2+-binding EF-hand superfamily protein
MVETKNLTIPFQYKKTFSPEECTELTNAFRNYDTNKNGTI